MIALRARRPEGEWQVLDEPGDVIRALMRYADVFDPRTGSIIVLGGAGRNPSERDPFKGGFISRIEERTELLRRIHRLDPRSRRLLSLWYVQQLPVVRIAREMKLSRMHCYRLRNKALDLMTQPAEDAAPLPAG